MVSALHSDYLKCVLRIVSPHRKPINQVRISAFYRNIMTAAKEYIIDTSIWVDLYDDPKGYNNEPLGDYALKLLVNIKSTGMVIILTDFLIRELETIYSVSEINGMFKPFDKNLKKIIATENQ